MGFEVFEFRGRTFSDETLLTISKAGVFIFNTAAAREMFDKVERMILMYDADTNRMAIKPVKKDVPHSFKFNKGKMNGFGAQSFLNYYKIDFSVTRKYELVWDEDLKAAVVDLNKVHALGRGSYKRDEG
ncbi:MAG: hypothetical protein PHG65_13250 [Kiritimatiellae bacterium]|nr:hypothetical protein [Kiritimatiellia bacterium]